MKYLFRLLIICLALCSLVWSVEEASTNSTTATPAEKPKMAMPSFSVTVFSYYRYDASTNSQMANKFDVSRAYFRLSEKFTPNLRGNFMIDLQANDSVIPTLKSRDIFIKEADLEVEGVIPLTKFMFGIQPSMGYGAMEAFWSHRYVEKTVGDQAGYLSAADLGATTKTTFGDLLYIGLGLYNGAGWNNIKISPLFRYSANIGIANKDLPVYAHFYADYYPTSLNNQGLATKGDEINLMGGVGVTIIPKVFKLGAEFYDAMNNKGSTAGASQFLAFSGVTSLYLVPDLFEIFGRFDYFSTQDGTTAKPDYNQVIAGVQISPTLKPKELAIAIDYRGKLMADTAKNNISQHYFDVDFVWSFGSTGSK